MTQLPGWDLDLHVLSLLHGSRTASSDLGDGLWICPQTFHSWLHPLKQAYPYFVIWAILGALLSLWGVVHNLTMLLSLTTSLCYGGGDVYCDGAVGTTNNSSAIPLGDKA